MENGISHFPNNIHPSLVLQASLIVSAEEGSEDGETVMITMWTKK